MLVEERGQTYLADNDADSDDARTLRPLQAAACTYRIAFGPRAGQKVLTLQGAMPREAGFKQDLCADIDGFSLHAAVRCDVRVHGVARQSVAIFRQVDHSSGATTARSAVSAGGHNGERPWQQTWRQRLVDPGHDCLVEEVPKVHALAQACLMGAEPTR